MSIRPSRFQLKLLDNTSHPGTDIMSFRFNRSDDQHENHYLDYKAGQYAVVDLGTKEDPEGPVRSFTIASSPTEEFILISTRIRETSFKKKLANLDPGSPVNITAPMGKFVLHGNEISRSIIFLSGGIGVTPFRSMIKYAADKRLSTKIVMFDSNRNEENILYKKTFDECVSVNKNLGIIYTITGEKADDSWRGEKGFINKEMLTRYSTTKELDNSVFYICGPPAMLKAMGKMLQDDLHTPEQRIKIEEFTGY